jgi:hypothetical protein
MELELRRKSAGSITQHGDKLKALRMAWTLYWVCDWHVNILVHVSDQRFTQACTVMKKVVKDFNDKVGL